MKKLLLFLLLVVPMFGEEYKGVPIPKGVTLDYDRLEDKATFKMDADFMFSGAPLIVLIMEKNDKFSIGGVVACLSENYVTSAKVFIENGKDIKSFELSYYDYGADHKNFEIEKGKLEMIFAGNADFGDFLIEHLKPTSRVTVRFYDDPQKDIELKKAELDKILVMLDLRNRLQATLKK